MSKERNLNYKLFTTAVVATTVLGLVVLFLSYYVGRNEFFLLLNGNLGGVADFFFRYYTYMGDGIWWIPCMLIFIKKFKQLLPLVLSSCVFTTLFIQVCKQLILPDVLRPLLAIEAQEQVHYVTGVIVHTTNSFPSGHAATAFTFLLLASLLTKKVWPLMVAAVGALLVGYSRVYLGQHFPLDVGAGMLVASCSVLLSLVVQNSFTKNKNFGMPARQQYQFEVEK